MKVSRSTFTRRGYLLTALTVAVLLAVSSGTAWAQSLRFNTSRATVEEGASTTDTAAPGPLKVNVSRSGEFRVDGDGDGELDEIAPWGGGTSDTHVTIKVVEYDGSSSPTTIPFQISARSGDAATSSPVDLTLSGVSFGFGGDATRTDQLATRIDLTITHTGDNDDWNVETLVLELEATDTLVTHLGSHKLPPIPPSTDVRDSPKKVSYGTRKLTVTVEDDDPMPKFRFGRADIQLAKGNTQKVKVGVRIGSARGSGGGSIQERLFGLDGVSPATGDEVLLSVDPADADGKIIKITKDVSGTATRLVARSPGEYVVGTIGGTAGVGLVTAATGSATDGIELTIEAIGASGFKDERISLTLMDGRIETEQRGEGGPIDDSDPATVSVLSGEETPTVTFTKESVTIDEGAMETVHILADTDQGDKVGSVAVSVRGEATIVLEQGGSQISGGVVDFGGGANAELTIRALPDARLEDGEEKMATVTITDAGGANIGDPRSLMVTVVGKTNVPVLPLVAQLLLALLLTVGGARLYRRRQQ